MKPFIYWMVTLMCMPFSLAQSAQDSLPNQISPQSPHQIETYIDSLVISGMDKYRIPGVALTIITDSSEVFYKGYGFADLENERQVDADKTGFRIASITKTFTATAIMQLVEQSKLDLHTPVREYLPDDNFEFLKYEPFTIHQLLTHTAGFDLTDTGDAALRSEEVISIEDMARYHMPDQVHKPGTVHSYSNFGYTLLGYLIQLQSGMSYEEYIREHIFNPLGMINSDLSQPLPPGIKENLARSYVWKGEQIYLPRDYTNTSPGGGIVSTAADMAPYMLMHLHGGSLDSTQILGFESHNILISQQYGSKNTKYGICYAFFENTWTARRSLEHTGGQLGFVSIMILIPETGTALFIVQNNRKDAGGFRYEIARNVLDTLIGQKQRVIIPLSPPANFDSVAEKYVGRYKQMNYPKNTFENFIRFFGRYTTEYWVSYKGNGIMDIRGDEYIMVDDHLFQVNNPESTFKMEFILDDKDQAEYLRIGVSTYKRVPWYNYKRVLQFGLIIPVLMILIHLIVHPIRRRRINRNRINSNLYTDKLLSKWSIFTSLVLIVGVIGVFAINGIYQDQMNDYGVPFALKLILAIFTLAAILALLSPYMLWRAFKKGQTTLNKLKYSIVIMAIVLTCLTLYHFKMIGFHYY